MWLSQDWDSLFEAENRKPITYGGGLRLIAIGVIVGLAGAFTLSRFVSAFLYGVPASDPWTYGVVIAVLMVTGLFAAYLPARRAAHVDPLVALRHE